jgi:hypothetical protein
MYTEACVRVYGTGKRGRGPHALRPCTGSSNLRQFPGTSKALAAMGVGCLQSVCIILFLASQRTI